MVGSNLKDQQLQQIVDKTIMEADLDGDGKISFEEFTKMVENTDVSMSMTLDQFWYDCPSIQLDEINGLSMFKITNETQLYNWTGYFCRNSLRDSAWIHGI